MKAYEGAIRAAAVDGDPVTDATVKALLAELHAANETDKAKLHGTREKARSFGVGPSLTGKSGKALTPGKGKAHRYVKAIFPKAEYRPGMLVTAIAMSRSRDAEEQASGKAMLADLGVVEVSDGPNLSMGFIGDKATLGTTGATGGYVLPNNLVDDVIKPEIGSMDFSSILTVVPGVAVRGVDQPYRTGAPDPALPINWGSTKTNVDEAYGSYTATLATFAKIYDVGKQYLRFSAGAAEKDVLDELGKSFSLAERKAIIAGPGTGAGTPGVNDPTLGVYTALAADDPTFTTTFSGASKSTILGNAAAGLAQGIKAMVARGQTPTAVLVDAVTYWEIATEGSDSAGFFLAGAQYQGGARGFQVVNGVLQVWGVPVYFDNYMDAWTATTKCAIIGNWRKLKMYRGMEFRIDTTDVAGDRWDKNLVGFRGEEEIGINAHTAVATGAFQLVKALIP